jgi:deazaflavin-dependent oxidoreductase (nitroreductase family)
MSTARRAFTRWGNRLGVWLYRRSRGRLGGPGHGTTIALITTPGRTTGAPRTVAIGLHQHDTRFLAVGTGSGSAQEPDWFQNLRAAARADIQIRANHIRVQVRITANGERDRLWRDVILTQAPRRAKYQQRSGRVIPIAVLTPIDPTP